MFAHARTSPEAGRRVALDAITLGRPDLIGACGLADCERDWLRLVVAARQGDVAEVLATASALPANRYRHKIAVLAAFAWQLRTLPGAAERLGSHLTAFAPTESAAKALLRVLGLAPSSARERLADASVLAARFGVPDVLVRLATTEPGQLAEGEVVLLGPRGRLVVAHRGPGRSSSRRVAIWTPHPCPSSTTSSSVDSSTHGGCRPCAGGRTSSPTCSPAPRRRN
ncbi:hypothetical protein ACFQV2_03555 [Actinokineospora soli]|uniref:Uncharacterized protein n=1 Tax=Actinokineospora soli TaxID=1048753 RepID=A0ABW2TJ31_9PSEU